MLTLKKKPDHISKIIPLNFESHGKNRYFSPKHYLSSRKYCADVGFCFDNTAEELIKNAIFFAQIPKTFVQLVFFQNVLFPPRSPFNNWNAALTTLLKIFADWPQVLHSKSEKSCENERSSKNYLHGKRFTGPVECTFNNPAPSFLARRPKNFCSWSDKKCKVMSSFGVFLPKTLHSTQLLKQFRKKAFFTEEVRVDKQSASVTNLHKETCQMSETVFARVQKKLENNFFSKKKSFFLWIFQMSKRSQSIFKTKCFAQNRSFPRESSSGNVECNFDNPVEKKSINLQRCLAKIRKSRWKKLLSKSVYKKVSFKKSFPKIFPWHVKCNSANSRQNNCAKSPN